MGREYETSEAALTKVATMAAADFVRITKSGVSNSITLSDMTAVLEVILRNTFNFVTDSNFTSKTKITSYTSADTAAATDGTILADPTSASFTLKLPSIADMYNATTGISVALFIRNITAGANDVTLTFNDDNPTALLNGAATYEVSGGTYPEVTVVCDGTNFFIF